MKFTNFVRTLFFLASAGSIVADEDSVDYEDLLYSPNTLWTAKLLPGQAAGDVEIEGGNGVFMAPDGKHALVTTVGATVYAFNVYSGENVWTYQATGQKDSTVRCHSGVVFGPSSDYMVYAVVDNEDSPTPTSRVVALDMSGNEVWISDDLDGVAAGNPQISSDGAHVFLTHNDDELSNGHFSIIDGETGEFYYGASSEEAGDEPTKRYGPLGIFHTPEQGNYDPITSGAPISEGDFNANDMLLWSQTPKPSDTTIENGFLYGFQFPRDYDGNVSEISYFQMGSFERDFQSLTAPVITNNGLSAYWGVSRGGFRGWTPKRFSRARTVSVGFTRNTDFAGQPVWAQPALSNDGPEPTIFSGTSAREFVRMSYDFDDQYVIPTAGYVKSAAKIDGDERAVYYVEDTGMVHAADFDDLFDLWTVPMDFTVTGEIALSPRSDVLLVGSGDGVIKAFQVAEIPVTDAPTGVPSAIPTDSPTATPTITKAPIVTTPSPTVSPTDNLDIPTEPPVEPATDSPVEVPEPETEAPVAVEVEIEPETEPDTPESSGSIRSLFMASAAIIFAAMLL